MLFYKMNGRHLLAEDSVSLESNTLIRRWTLLIRRYYLICPPDYSASCKFLGEVHAHFITRELFINRKYAFSKPDKSLFPITKRYFSTINMFECIKWRDDKQQCCECKNEKCDYCVWRSSHKLTKQTVTFYKSETGVLPKKLMYCSKTKSFFLASNRKEVPK